MTAALIRGDAIRLPLADESVDAVITSPPYFALRSYQDGGEHYDGQIGSEATPQAFLEALWAVTAECARVLKPTGSMFVNLGDKYGPNKSLMLLPERYRVACVDQLGLIARAVIVWDKPNGLPESVTDRVRRSHEDWVHLTKAPRYYAAVDEIREAHAPTSLARYGYSDEDYAGRFSTDDETTGKHRKGNPLGNPLGKLPGSVWRVPSEPLKVPDWVGVDHYAAFPQEFPRRLILGWTPPGYCLECGQARTAVVDKQYRPIWKAAAEHKVTVNPDNRRHTDDLGKAAEVTITGYSCACPTPDAPPRPAIVLDPFAGTGTSVMVARALGRYGVGVDLSADYLRLARWRIFESGHAAKSNARTWAERQEVLL